MTLEEKFNEDLHGGKQINGQVRYNGCYMGEDDKGHSTVKFDNGNFYVFKDHKVIKHIEGTDVYFINDHITEAIYSFIDSNLLMLDNHTYSDYNSEDAVEFYFNDKTVSDNSRGTLIRLVINRDSKNIEISNIFIEYSLKCNGFGKKIILEIFKIACKHNYRLFLVQMVPSFYDKMIKRGAKDIAFEDVVEITATTVLQ
ncbi:MAG: hypothetical protein JNM71_17570 [Flavobacterium lindanitolerans]|uniref:Uncharacterized protein n=1 Tax=Flavobacterium microcysteis TaxID=2596891 RepID=A0A501Q243_9FLAO|nr:MULTISPECIES: hypothetical protein [Flavobacterium]MBL7869823.1 hypothetical protein [Flavobacterium lindanitolerans]TPD66001.1 hypothetical protein FJA49_17645 [Flavobacterium microcysteis]